MISQKDSSFGAQLSDRTAIDTITYDRSTGIYRTQFDFHTRLPSEATIEAIAAATDSDPTEIPPLFAAIDPDALNRLFAPTLSNLPRGDGAITFGFGGRRITVRSCGIVEVSDDDIG